MSKGGEPAILGAASWLPAPKKWEQNRNQRAEEKESQPVSSKLHGAGWAPGSSIV